MNQESFAQEIFLRGYPICPGVAIGKPFFFAASEEKIPEFSVSREEIEGEVARYYRALNASQNDVAALQKRLQLEGIEEAVAILGSHLEMMKDPLINEQMEEQIRLKGKNSEYVFKSVIREYEKNFSKITDQFFQERLKDFKDISRRIIDHLRQRKRATLSDLNSRLIVFAHELSPSDTAEAKTEHIEAFVTRSGAETSHVAIMARAKDIPFVSNVQFPDFSMDSHSEVIVDGISGDVVLNPSNKTLKIYRDKEKIYREKIKVRVVEGRHYVDHQAETIDGYKVRLSANIEYQEQANINEWPLVIAERIGLFRTEYLFLANDAFPTEEEQFQCYKKLVENISGQPTVIRTFDIGGDKFGYHHPSRYEKNPYLGCRAIRLMLKERPVFKTQLRAIVRASAFGEVSILFPMISGLSELLAAKELVEEAKDELKKEGIPFSRQIPIGCMIEVPSAAMTCDVLLKECDFLSIGTNDLVQYSLAVDRGNPAMSYLYSPTHPGIIRLIKFVVQEGNRFEKPVSVCGEIAADPRFTPLLLGLGVHELSVSTPALSIIKEAIRLMSIVEATDLAEELLNLSTAEEVMARLVATHAQREEKYPRKNQNKIS